MQKPGELISLRAHAARASGDGPSMLTQQRKRTTRRAVARVKGHSNQQQDQPADLKAGQVSDSHIDLEAR